MSYDLVFWKQSSSNTDPPSQTYRLLLDGTAPNGVAEIRTGQLLDRVRQEFPGVKEEGGLMYWDGEDNGMFEIYSSPHHIHFCCRGLPGEEMNRLIDIAAEFDCKLYDPQTDVRYTG